MVTSSKPLIKSFVESFSAQNNGRTSKVEAISKNIASIDALLKQFMNMEDREALLKQVAVETKQVTEGNRPLPSYNTRAPYVEVSVNGVQVVYPGQTDNPNFQVLPFRIDASATETSAPLPDPILDVFFRDLNLDMALGGAVGTIRGSLQLFSREPLDFLTFLYDFKESVDTIDALPQVSLRFGWVVAGETDPVKLLSPKLDFLVMNVKMEDPSGEYQGSLFTLDLQDAGSAMYENSAADFALRADYPQEQLRILVEKVMGVRLFTLDDLLQLTPEGKNDPSVTITTETPDYKTLNPENSSDFIILQRLASDLTQQSMAQTGDTPVKFEKSGITLFTPDAKTARECELSPSCLPYLSNNTKAELIRTYLNTPHVVDGTSTTSTLADSDKYKRYLNIVNYIWLLKRDTRYKEYMENTVAIITHDYETNTDYVTYSEKPKDSDLWKVEQSYDIIFKKDYAPAFMELYNWLLTKQLKNSLSSLLDETVQIILKVIPKRLPITSANLRKDIEAIFGNTSKEESIIQVIEKFNAQDSEKVKSALSIIFNENPSLRTKTFFVNGQHPVLRLNSSAFSDVISTLVSKIQCRWYPETNSSLETAIKESASANDIAYKAYRDYKNALLENPTSEETKKLKTEYETARVKKAYGCRLVYVSAFPASYQTSSKNIYIPESEVTDGAFLLLPNINPLDVSDDEMPLIYGPGGSQYPYLFGGAQNLKQVMGHLQGSLPQMIGEVMDVKVNYNNLTALIKSNFNEDVAVLEAGQRISKSIVKEGPKLSPEEQKKKKIEDRNKYKEKLMKQLNAKYPNTNTEDLLAKYEEIMKSLQERVRVGRKFRDYATVYSGRRVLYKGDSLSNTTIPSERTYTNAVAPETAAKDFVAQRLGNMLYSSTSISMAVLGDPFLIRQGVGAFELLHYFLDRAGTGIRYNYLLSGVYMVQSINHHISAGQYITNIKAFKIPPVDNTFSNRLDAWRRQSTITSTNADISNEITANTKAMVDLATKSINLETLEQDVLSENLMTSIERIATESLINTEIKKEGLLKDIHKFYSNLQ